MTDAANFITLRFKKAEIETEVIKYILGLQKNHIISEFVIIIGCYYKLSIYLTNARHKTSHELLLLWIQKIFNIKPLVRI